MKFRRFTLKSSSGPYLYGTSYVDVATDEVMVLPKLRSRAGMYAGKSAWLLVVLSDVVGLGDHPAWFKVGPTYASTACSSAWITDVIDFVYPVGRIQRVSKLYADQIADYLTLVGREDEMRAHATSDNRVYVGLKAEAAMILTAAGIVT